VKEEMHVKMIDEPFVSPIRREKSDLFGDGASHTKQRLVTAENPLWGHLVAGDPETQQ